MGYWTVEKSAGGYYEVKSSKFWAYIVPIAEAQEANSWLRYWWANHPKANHICYAYRLGVEDHKTKTNDDGEPANTAGQPILNHLEGRDLTQVMLAVVRYFGGVKLGKGGLISAYGQAAKAALTNAAYTWKTQTWELKATIPYADYPVIVDAVKKSDIAIVQQEYFSENCCLTLEIPEELIVQWKSWLEAYL